MTKNGLRWIVFAGMAGLAVAGCGDPSSSTPMDCGPGQAKVTANYNGGAAQSDSVTIDLLIDGKMMHTEMRSRTLGAAQDNFIVDLNMVTVGQMAEVVATAMHGSMAVGTGRTTVTRSEMCQSITLEIGEKVTPPDMATPDLSMPDLAPYPDLSMPDLAPYPDLTPPPDLMPVCSSNANCQADGGIKGGACCMVNGAAACVDTTTDKNNCGACNKACAMGNACCSALCTDTMTDKSNCGGCGKFCNLPGATAACTAGACTVAMCTAGLGNCDKMDANGCEANLVVDSKNCGACGTVCPGSATCMNSQCTSIFTVSGKLASEVQSGDFNGDGKPDVVVLSQSLDVNAPGDAELWLNMGKGTYGNRINVKTVHEPKLLLVGDMNNDKLLDIVTSGAISQIDGNLEVKLGDGKGGFTPGNVANSRYEGIGALGDFDGDGFLDFVGNDGRTNLVSFDFQPGDGKGGWKPMVFVGFNATGPTTFFPIDINGDKALDFVTPNYTTNNVTVALGNGKGTWVTTNYAAGKTPNTLAAGDVNGDGKVDVVAGAFGDNALNVFLGNGDGTLKPKTDVAAAGVRSGLSLVDINGDGKLDAVFDTVSSSYYSLGDGNGSFAAPVRIGSGFHPRVADFDGDGHADVLVYVNGQNIAIIYYLNVK